MVFWTYVIRSVLVLVWSWPLIRCGESYLRSSRHAGTVGSEKPLVGSTRKQT
jgi:hypothetical protein